MRRFIAITITAAAFAAGCGDDTVNQGAQPLGAASLAAETQRLADQIAQAARELADNPDADVDDRLERAQERAETLSDQSRDELDESRPELADSLAAANERLAEAASQLRDVESTAAVADVLDDELGTAADRLADAAGRLERVNGTDGRRALERARDELEGLGGELGG